MEAPFTDDELSKIAAGAGGDASTAIWQLIGQRNEARTKYAQLLVADISRYEAALKVLKLRLKEGGNGPP